MASNPPGKCCAEGHKHVGDAIGKHVDIAGIDNYVVGDSSAKKVLLFVTDIYGNDYINAKLLADEFAAKGGFYVVIPDLFNKDPFDHDGGLTLESWLGKHQPGDALLIVEKVADAIKADLKPEYFVATGYCYGAKLVLNLLGEKQRIDVGAIFHPSFVTLDEVKAIQGPIFIAGAEVDPIYTEELRHQSEAVLRDLKKTYFTTLSSGVSHGFAVRGDISDPVVKQAKERAFRHALDWFAQFEPTK